jgi:hypothetical protein
MNSISTRCYIDLTEKGQRTHSRIESGTSCLQFITDRLVESKRTQVSLMVAKVHTIY